MANPWAAFRRLLPSQALVVVTVVSVDDTGTSIVRLVSGEQLRVQGVSVEAGKKAFFRQGVIVAEAPSLPQHAIEV